MTMFQNAEPVGTSRTALANEGERIESAHKKESSANFGTSRSDNRLDINGRSRGLLELRQEPQ
jgi:hypothetical protein